MNLTLLERFDGDLSGWTLGTVGGTVSIVIQDHSTKLRLNDTSASSYVSATKTYEEPSCKYLLEYDINVATSGVGICDLLDSSDNVIVTVDVGTIASTLSFSTNSISGTTSSFPHDTHVQVILVVDPISKVVSCYMTDQTPSPNYRPLKRVGINKSYTGSVSKLLFKTATTNTGIVYIDEVKIYTPRMVVIGDSICDGKLIWANEPTAPAGRLTAAEDQTSSPSYQQSLLIGSNVWVGNRAFGGSNTSTVLPQIPIGIIEHGFTSVFASVGHNDLGIYSYATITANYNSIISTLQAAGITGKNILFGNIKPAYTLIGKESVRQQVNSWIATRMAQIGGVLIDNATSLRDPSDYTRLNPIYDGGDGVHLNKVGSGVMAANVFNGMAIPRASQGYLVY